MATVYKREFVNGVVAHSHEVTNRLKEIAEGIEIRAEQNLVSARATTTHQKVAKEREHETKIGKGHTEGKYGSIDWEVFMEGENPMALEFGHTASGYFNHERFPLAKSPHGLYILTRAAGLGELNVVPSATARGKRGPTYGKR